jgi:hypothetical protein
VLDFHRLVLPINHSFSSNIRFVRELELEQAYPDFLLKREFNLRAGIVLMPIGIINERHEPPVYQGVERPFVDTMTIPTTWFEGGVGVHGELSCGFSISRLRHGTLERARVQRS